MHCHSIKRSPSCALSSICAYYLPLIECTLSLFFSFFSDIRRIPIDIFLFAGSIHEDRICLHLLLSKLSRHMSSFRFFNSVSVLRLCFTIFLFAVCIMLSNDEVVIVFSIISVPDCFYALSFVDSKNILCENRFSFRFSNLSVVDSCFVRAPLAVIGTRISIPKQGSSFVFRDSLS